LRLAATGTGFFVAKGIVLTNFHVAGSCKALTIGNNSEGEELPASLSASDMSDDLAILSAADPSSRPAPFALDMSRETGSGLAIVGYPEHGLVVLQAELDEVVASPDDLASARPYFPFAGPVRRGNSGSPVLDARGAVLGIVRAKIDTPAFYRATGEVVDRIGYAISTPTILSFLRANHVSVNLAPQAINLSPDELLDRAHRFVRQIGCWN
jgi:S1-C subfamily serine protease